MLSIESKYYQYHLWHFILKWFSRNTKSWVYRLPISRLMLNKLSAIIYRGITDWNLKLAISWRDPSFWEMKCKSQDLGSSLFCFLFLIWNALCKFIQKFDVYLKRFLLIFENLKPSIFNFTCKLFLSFFFVEKCLQVCMPYPVRLDILTLKCSKLSMDWPVIVNYNTIMAGGCRRFCSNFCKIN